MVTDVFFLLLVYLTVSFCDPSSWYPDPPFLYPTFQNESTVPQFIKLMQVLPGCWKNIPDSLIKVNDIIRFGSQHPPQQDFIDGISQKLVEHYVFRYSVINAVDVSTEIKQLYRQLYEFSTNKKYLKLSYKEKQEYIQKYSGSYLKKLTDNDKAIFDRIEQSAIAHLNQLGLYHDVEVLAPRK